MSHPTIKDGWFREESSQWPGQAMSIKVAKVLHTEKSKFQDVLVFQSETYGNVLVLDGVIQCTERDEFSYQEMIAHIPLNAHPNPKRVLVIGGGDGGVVREVLKHESVDHVDLVDIDEAVPRVSKTYLPHMAALLNDNRCSVHIADGFAYLQDPKLEKYDVIITDSSDPVGPASALFQPPYFQLLHNALNPGGHISTQSECLWLHLPFIKSIQDSVKKIFEIAEYAFTTIPTYPSGQIGFVIAKKAGGPPRDVKAPLRTVPGCRYYNNNVHKAAFVLPEFGRVLIEEGRDILPDLTPREEKASAKSSSTKKILILGSGYVAGPCASYLLRSPNNHLTIAARSTASASTLKDTLIAVNPAAHNRITPIALDVSSPTGPAELETALKDHDLVISLIPYTQHATVIKAAIATKTNVVTTSYVSPSMLELHEQAIKAGILVFNEIGLDPGIDHLYAVKTISEVKAKGGKITEFVSYCGGLTAPENATNPLGYKFSWSARGVLLALLNPATYIKDGKSLSIPGGGSALMDSATRYSIPLAPSYNLVGYANRDSSPFKEKYRIPEAEVILRGTLRYAPFVGIIKALVEIGWLDATTKDWLKSGAGSLTWAQITQKVLGASTASEPQLIATIRSKVPEADKSVIAALKWLGIFSENVADVHKDANLLDTLCKRLEKMDEMLYHPGERDLIILRHEFGVQWKDGSSEKLTSTLELYGSPQPPAPSAMSLTVGVPCGIASQLILDAHPSLVGEGKWGVRAPYDYEDGGVEVCEVLRKEVEKEGIGMVERSE
ncbi:spermidine synthase [Sistotremastrum niveocremeum HHB9708]|uniref:Spermidine synthase n=1 Tax=Sistotremastrum niveocremeum HHB9708 TaxID=1314777 RepID=A0A164WLL7_9AGAM|nr:spermidine synthase [Sistotremastrum niveocremeum HHB9708]